MLLLLVVFVSHLFLCWDIDVLIMWLLKYVGCCCNLLLIRSCPHDGGFQFPGVAFGIDNQKGSFNLLM